AGLVQAAGIAGAAEADRDRAALHGWSGELHDEGIQGATTALARQGAERRAGDEEVALAVGAHAVGPIGVGGAELPGPQLVAGPVVPAHEGIVGAAAALARQAGGRADDVEVALAVGAHAAGKIVVGGAE